MNQQSALELIRQELINFRKMPEIAYAGDFIGDTILPRIKQTLFDDIITIYSKSNSTTGIFDHEKFIAFLCDYLGYRYENGLGEDLIKKANSD